MEIASDNLPSNKKFGYFFSAVFFLIAIYFVYQDERIIGALLCSLSLSFILITKFKDYLLLPLNKLWMRFGILLGKIISPIILAILFFVMFAPIALGMRLFQRDELQLKSLDFESFWKPRDKDMFHKSSFTQQF